VTSHLPAIIVGDISLLRCFAGSGIPTELVSTDPHSLAFHSRWCRRRHRIADPHADPEQAVEDLAAIGRRFTPRPPLFVTTDTMLLLLSRNRERLSPCYRFLMPPAQLIEQLVAKTAFAELAQRLGFPVPPTVTSQQCPSPRAILERISLPCVLKPSLRAGWFQSPTVRDEGGQPRKVLRADTPADFARLHDSIRRWTDSFIVQEYVPGHDDCIYSFHAYYNAESRPLAFFVGRKVRTYPRDSGLSCFVRLVEEPSVAELGMNILAKLSFVGPVKIDFKYDARRNRFRLLEINPRYNLWHHLGAACGISLPQIAYHDLLGEPQALPKSYSTRLRWVSFAADMLAFVHDYHPRGELSLLRWLWSYTSPKVYDVFAWSDPVPLLVCMGRFLRRLLNKLARRCADAIRNYLRHPRQPGSADSGAAGAAPAKSL
jgi:predicted ATP-grasp superfamily ATP-dependent carboligase